METEVVLSGLAAVPIIVGLVQAIKAAAPGLNHGLLPLIAIALGVGWNVGASFALADTVVRQEVAVAALMGVVLGLSASGLYAGGAEAARQLEGGP